MGLLVLHICLESLALELLCPCLHSLLSQVILIVLVQGQATEFAVSQDCLQQCHGILIDLVKLDD